MFQKSDHDQLNPLSLIHYSQCTYNAIIEERSCNRCRCGKAVSVTKCECVFVALGNQCACAVLSSVACSALQYTFTLSHKRHDLRGAGGGGRVTEHKMCVPILSTTLAEAFLILGIIQLYTFNNVYGCTYTVHYQLSLSDVNET
jgi:hypothetical protein